MQVLKRISGLGTGSFLLLCDDFDCDGRKEILTEIADGELIIMNPFTEKIKYTISIGGKISYGAFADIDNDDKLEIVLCCYPNRIVYLKNLNVVSFCELVSIPTVCFSLKNDGKTYLAALTATFSIEFIRGDKVIGRFQCVPPIALSRPFSINGNDQEFFVLDGTGTLTRIRIIDDEISTSRYLQVPLKPIHAELLTSDENVYLLVASGKTLEIWDLKQKSVVFKMSTPFRIIKLISADFNGDSRCEIIVISSSQLSTIIHVLDSKSFDDVFSLEINGFWIPILVKDINKDFCDEILLRGYETKLKILGLTYNDEIDLHQTITVCEICDIDDDNSNEILVREINGITILKTS